MSAHRDLSIVIAAPEPGSVLLECLGAIEPQLTPNVEVLLAATAGKASGVRETVRTRFPWVRVVDSPARSLPKLRGVGMAEAAGTIVGVLDSWCLVGSDWIADALRSHAERKEPVIGGGVDLDESRRNSLASWATYLFDYWEFVPPFPPGPVPVLPGNNITYKRDALPDAQTLRAAGFWKAFTNVRLKQAGHSLFASSGLGVRLKREMSLGRFFRSRFHHGRSYAGMRVEGAGWPTRLKWSLITPGLPALFLARQARGLRSKRGYRGRFVLSLPLLLAFHVSWAFGELMGYLAGAGHSHDAIRS